MKKDATQKSFPELCHDAFHNIHSSYFGPVNDIFAFLTIVSVCGLVLETVHGLAQCTAVFLFIEYVTAFFFACEYIARIIATKRPLRYMFSFFGIVDLLAIVPTFLGIANFTFLKSVRLLRILRFLRMIRLAKLLRMKRTYEDIEKHGHDHLFSLTMQIYLVTLFTVILLSATMMWFVEGDRAVFANIPVAMIWSSKVLLGGISQAMPETIFGEIVAVLTRFMGLVLFSLLISIVGGSVARLLFGTEKLCKQSRRAKKQS